MLPITGFFLKYYKPLNRNFSSGAKYSNYDNKRYGNFNRSDEKETNRETNRDNRKVGFNEY